MAAEDSKTIAFDLSFTYENAEREALKEVTGSVPKGTCIVLCGGSGCGKSTLLRCMNHLIPQFYEGRLKGFLRIAGQDLKDLSIGETGRLAASVFQDPRSQFFTLNSLTEVAFGLENFGFSHDEMVRRVDEVFEAFHLEYLKDRNVFSLSSGERQMIAILAAYAVKTDVFLLDEPTANLDSLAIKRLTGMLLKLKEEKQTMVISEHRLSYLKDLADEYWYMEDGKITKRFMKKEMLELFQRERESLGLRMTDFSAMEQKTIEEIPPVIKENRFQAEDISFSYSKKGRKILNQISLEAKTGEVIGLIGHNGCGKTTFGKLATGLLKGNTGHFLLNGKALNTKELSYNSIFIMQEAEFQFFTNSVSSEVSYGMEHTEENRQKIMSLLKETGLWECRKQHPFSLSGGQMQRLVLLLAYLSPKPIVVLDEPTAGLDYKNMMICAGLIQRMRKEKIIFVITHDLELIAGACSRCVNLEGGKVSGEYSMKDREAFRAVKSFMDGEVPKKEENVQRSQNTKEHFLDPRLNLLIALIAMLVGVWTDIPLILTSFTAVLLALFYQRHFAIGLGMAGTMAAIFLLNAAFPQTLFSFVVYFFSRVILIGAAAALLVTEKEAPRMIAGFRKLHIPERAVMVASVVFRFFPVLTADLKMMSQSIKTRGIFSTLAEKLKAIPAYAEILIVPMVFRVIRIAEALAASAETRGISLPGRRDSYIAIGFHRIDFVILVLTMALILFGFLC